MALFLLPFFPCSFMEVLEQTLTRAAQLLSCFVRTACGVHLVLILILILLLIDTVDYSGLQDPRARSAGRRPAHGRD